jgi:hypothetical protein
MPPPAPSTPALHHPTTPYPYAPGSPPPAQTNALSVASLVLGIVWLGGLGSLLAVIFGHIGLGQVKRSHGTQTGRGLALAGTILGYVGCIAAITIAAIVFTDTRTATHSPAQAIGQDSEAKSNARNLVSQIETCATDYAGDYTNCNSSDLSNTGLNLGTGRGQVAGLATSASTYEVVAKSKSGDTFTITKADNGVSTRTCDPVGQGGCQPADAEGNMW